VIISEKGIKNGGFFLARDVKIWKDDGAFKLRVCGVIKVGDKYLIDNCDHCEFYSYPGGHVQIGEATNEAVLRETLEETGIDCEIDKMLANIELFFSREDGNPFHEIGYYYLLKPKAKIEAIDFSREEEDKGKLRSHEFKWVTVDELLTLDVKPVALKEVIRQGLECKHIIYREDN